MKPYYSDGTVTIIHGDSLEAMAGLKEAGTRADIIWTDPPYGNGNNETRTGITIV